MFKQRISPISIVFILACLGVIIAGTILIIQSHERRSKAEAEIVFSNVSTFCPQKEPGEDTNIYGQTMEEANEHRNWKDGVYTPVCLGILWSFKGETSPHFLYLTASSTEEEIVEAVQEEAKK